ncbi:MAG: cysteine--tRNA ligase [Oligoflexia bacterium]|nr:cysteine--tRNA ligase [Oligoflexia bacterium]
MTVRLFNTLSRQVEELKPLVPGKVSIYCCGPTVYDYQHIGNLRTYIFEDVLVRTLRLAGYQVTHVMNITDVGHLVSDADEGEDKMLVAMRREGKKSADIAQFYTDIFFNHCQLLHIKRPDIVCKATEHVQEMIELITRIERNGCTYISGGNVYFDISKLKDYGKLARLDIEKLMAGARIEVDQNKRNPYDFVLWFTKSKFENQELQWDSPWGRGYPGWHIECSAMSMKYLGEEFDIHCGGIDHIPVHHTNEIAQSEAATRKNWVRHWMHGEFLVQNKEKMSKSKGGFLTLDTILEKGFDPLTYRFFCLSAHYKAQLSWSWEALTGAAQGFERLKNTIIALKAEAPQAATGPTAPRIEEYRGEFKQALFNDLNVPKALATLWATLGDKQLSPRTRLDLAFEFDQVLGLGMQDWKEVALALPTEVQTLVGQRQAAREARNWGESDRLRGEIEKLGYSVEDAKGTQKVRKL